MCADEAVSTRETGLRRRDDRVRPIGLGLCLGATAITGLALVDFSNCGFINPSFEAGFFFGWIIEDLSEPFEPLRIDNSSGYEPGSGLAWGTQATDERQLSGSTAAMESR